MNAGVFTDFFWQHRKLNYPYISGPEKDAIIAAAIDQKTPFLGARMGANESFNLRVNEFDYGHKRKIAFSQLCEGAGFFPPEEKYLPRYCEIYKESIGMADLAFPLRGVQDQAYFYHKYAPKNVKYVGGYSWAGLEHSWIDAMEDRTLLVIHPFEDTIRSQFARIDRVFPTLQMFPKGMKLETLKAVQTIAGTRDDRFETWFDALQYMCDETDKKQFDFAIIACGAYSLPLGAHIKKMGGRAAVLGGGLQGHFGIIGKRWEDKPFYQTYKNEFWVRPSKEETPEQFRKVEGGCYW